MKRRSPPAALLLLGVLATGWIGWSSLRPRPAPETSATPAVPRPPSPATASDPVAVPGDEHDRALLASDAAPPDAGAGSEEEQASVAAAAASSAAAKERSEGLLSERDRQARKWIAERSTRFADELALAPGAELRIAELLEETDARLASVRSEAKALGMSPEGRAELREAAAHVRAWRNTAFEQAFGHDLAQQILALEDGPVVLGDADGTSPHAEDEAGGDF